MMTSCRLERKTNESKAANRVSLYLRVTFSNNRGGMIEASLEMRVLIKL